MVSDELLQEASDPGLNHRLTDDDVRDMAYELLTRRKETQEPTLFVNGQPVIVNNERYHGKGIVQYDTGKRGRMVGVLLGNGNTWEYEYETVTRERILGDKA